MEYKRVNFKVFLVAVIGLLISILIPTIIECDRKMEDLESKVLLLQKELEKVEEEYYLEEMEYISLSSEYYSLINSTYLLNKEIERLEKVKDYSNNMVYSSNLSESDIELLTKVSIAEAGRNNFEGQKAVCKCILNRMGDCRFPNTVKDVVYQEGQFSTVNNLPLIDEESYYNILRSVIFGYDLLPKEYVYFHSSKSNSNGINIGGNLFSKECF